MIILFNILAWFVLIKMRKGLQTWYKILHQSARRLSWQGNIAFPDHFEKTLLLFVKRLHTYSGKYGDFEFKNHESWREFLSFESHNTIFTSFHIRSITRTEGFRMLEAVPIVHEGTDLDPISNWNVAFWTKETTMLCWKSICKTTIFLGVKFAVILWSLKFRL